MLGLIEQFRLQCPLVGGRYRCAPYPACAFRMLAHHFVNQLMYISPYLS